MPEERWSEPERWAWQEIHAGRVVNFNERDGRELDPKIPEGWNDQRKLRSDFVKEILFRDPCRSAIPVEGVRIVGAWLPEPLDLAHARLNHQLWLDKCRFGAPVDLTGLTVDGWLSLEGSAIAQHGSVTVTAAKIDGSINMSGIAFEKLTLMGAKVDGHLYMIGASVAQILTMDSLEVTQSLVIRGAFFKHVDLGGARVDGQLSLIGTTVTGTMTMNGLRVGNYLLMRDSTFQNVDLGGAKIGGQLSLTGATVVGTLNMNLLEVGHLFMGRGAAFHNVDLGGAKVDGQLDMTGASVTGALNMNPLQVGQNLFMRAGTRLQDVNLGSAKIGGQLNLRDATVAGSLRANRLEVGQSLIMRGPDAAFRDVDLTSAKIFGQLDMTSTKIAGTLTMKGIEVGQHLLMCGPDASFRDVAIGAASIGGQLDMSSAAVLGKLTMESLDVGQHLFMWEATFGKSIELIFGCVGANLDLSGADFSGAEFTGLDLSGTNIEGELRLGSGDRPPPKWRKGARLTLRNTRAGVLQDRSDHKTYAWPEKLQLDGFTYGRLGGYGADTGRDPQARDIGWYIDWLARDPSYSPQPYEQLASVFRAAGEPTKANDVLYAGRKRARVEAWRQGKYFRWLGSSFLKWTIGYGLGGRYFLALGWVIAFTAIGAAVLHFSGQPSQGLATGLPARLVYSLDQLLPIVEFEKYDQIVLTGGVAYYFHIQKLIGWLLGSFLVAGLAGLTQR